MKFPTEQLGKEELVFLVEDKSYYTWGKKVKGKRFSVPIKIKKKLNRIIN